jgi:hypothetical protein
VLFRVPTRIAALAVAVCSLVSLSAAVAPAQAAPREDSPSVRRVSGPRRVELRAKDGRGHTFVRPQRPAKLAMQRHALAADSGATITVNYSGFTAQAQTAFQYAVDLWEPLIDSDVPIVVDASFAPLPTGVLGSAGATNFWTVGSDPTATGYPSALASAIQGVDVEPGVPDIEADFSSAFTNWYYGTDGSTPDGKYDFVSVVLHELGHGLGFAGSLYVEGGLGKSYFPSPFYARYDRLVENGAGTAITSFTRGSATLAGQLQSNNLFFDGTATRAANGGSPARLYAPSTWDDGSSFSHLNESTFPAGNVNSLMTPQIGDGEAIHTPGPIALGMFKDQGWGVNGAPGAPTGVTAVAGDGSAALAWTAPVDTGPFPITSYLITASPGGAQVTSSGAGTTTEMFGLSNDTAYTFTVAAVSSGFTSPASAPSNSVTPTAAAGPYTSLPPARIINTFDGTGGRTGKLGAEQTMHVDVTGVGGVPVSGVTAVAINMQATEPTATGYLTIHPKNSPRPSVSQVQFPAGKRVSNLVIAKVGADGSISVFNKRGATHVVGDVQGYFTTGTAESGGGYNGLTPARVLSSPVGLAKVGKLGPGQTMDLQVTGVGSVPASGVEAVVINMQSTASTTEGYLTVFPKGITRPVVANLTFEKASTMSILVIAKVGADGKISIFNRYGSTHVVGDIQGYYSDGTAPVGGVFTSLAPARTLNTVNGTGVAAGKVGPEQTITMTLLGRGGVPMTGVSAVAISMSVTDGTKTSYLTSYPTGEAKPHVATVPFPAGRAVANLVIAKVGTDGTIKIHNKYGSTHVVGDVLGYFTG